MSFLTTEDVTAQGCRVVGPLESKYMKEGEVEFCHSPFVALAGGYNLVGAASSRLIRLHRCLNSSSLARLQLGTLAVVADIGRALAENCGYDSVEASVAKGMPLGDHNVEGPYSQAAKRLRDSRSDFHKDGGLDVISSLADVAARLIDAGNKPEVVRDQPFYFARQRKDGLSELPQSWETRVIEPDGRGHYGWKIPSETVEDLIDSLHESVRLQERKRELNATAAAWRPSVVAGAKEDPASLRAQAVALLAQATALDGRSPSLADMGHQGVQARDGQESEDFVVSVEFNVTAGTFKEAARFGMDDLLDETMRHDHGLDLQVRNCGSGEVRQLHFDVTTESFEDRTAAGAPAAKYLVSESWGHCFVGSKESNVRWVLDLESEQVAYAQVANSTGWEDLNTPEADDILESILQNDVHKPEYGDDSLVRTNDLPTWAPPVWALPDAVRQRADVPRG